MLTIGLLILGSVLVWFLHVDYNTMYEELEPYLDGMPKREACYLLCREEFKNIMIVSLVLWLISSTALLISAGALITFITLKIPSLQRALNE